MSPERKHGGEVGGEVNVNRDVGILIGVPGGKIDPRAWTLPTAITKKISEIKDGTQIVTFASAFQLKVCFWKLCDKRVPTTHI